uniref:Uncharacterized protein n=1 Tax=Oryza rufipogon TaxID=4529 RepID=A0A0E0QYZ2_ORYRU
GPRRKPSPVIHRTDSGYTFGRSNLLGAFVGDGGILDVVTILVASFSSRLCGGAVGLAAFGHA